MRVKDVSKLLNVSDITIRREISKGSFGELEQLDNGEYILDYHHVLKFIEENQKYAKVKEQVVEAMCKEFYPNKGTSTDLDMDVLEAALLKKTITSFGTELLDAFASHLAMKESKQLLPIIMREVENKLNVVKQPTVQELQRILIDIISVDCHESIQVGDMLTADQIDEIFGRKPQQEGINFCRETKELYVITKLGVDNPTVVSAEYNDYWKNGKVFYEGKGQGDQKFTGSNLHLYRKLQVFHQIIKCKEGVPPYIHVFNRAKTYEPDKFQYLGKFYVTDYFVDNESIGRIQDTKTAIVFEFTPLVKKTSPSIDENYIF